ncbi:MAG: hypothetical protein K2Y27_17455 [Xanthobacteraceae bacterium]|nr:hypothetical protein [Xanthobacteraceae bacterium]
MTSENSSEPEGRILQFRPRGGSLFVHHAPPSPQVPDLRKFESEPEEPGEYRHRMLMNVLALGFTVLLVAGGIWIADVMAHMRKDQDCVLIGRPGCTPVNVPIAPR